MSDDSIICANPQCKVRETGRCFEGIETNQCPHFGREVEEGEASDDSGEDGLDEDSVESASLISLPAGRVLASSEAAELLCSGSSRVIAIVGSHAAGKTSLVAGLYDLFQQGAVDGVNFAGSRTMWNFELACHDSRAASGRDKAHMGRTAHGDARFFHLSVRADSMDERVELALADRAGEEYINSTNTPTLAMDFFEVKRADVISMLIDGRRLLDTGSRHNLKQETKLILETFKSVGIVSKKQRLALIMTKADMVKVSPHREATEEFYASIVDSVKALYGDIFSEIASFEVAASPQNGVTSRGMGVSNVLKFWLVESNHGGGDSPMTPLAIPSRVFSRITPRAEKAANE